VVAIKVKKLVIAGAVVHATSVICPKILIYFSHELQM
jgi:hypothetical protein